MDEILFKKRLDDYGAMVNEAILKYLPKDNLPQKNVFDAMRYSVMAGGKRIRPVLLLEFCRICGGNITNALPFACAIEFVHTYSLIHDDLPCMDDDDMRRGKPSCHVKYGYANALLAGDALLSLAFETALCNNNIVKVKKENAIKAAHELAFASGALGMVGGQVIDLESENKKIDIETLKAMHAGKTGAMIIAAAKMGCIVADADEAKLKAAEEYARKIGLAFQIVDDLLDVEGDEKLLGKPIGSDKEENKTTYVTYYGKEKSKEIVRKLTDEAILLLDNFDDTDFLRDLTTKLSCRKK